MHDRKRHDMKDKVILGKEKLHPVHHAACDHAYPVFPQKKQDGA